MYGQSNGFSLPHRCSISRSNSVYNLTGLALLNWIRLHELSFAVRHYSCANLVKFDTCCKYKLSCHQSTVFQSIEYDEIFTSYCIVVLSGFLTQVPLQWCLSKEDFCNLSWHQPCRLCPTLANTWSRRNAWTRNHQAPLTSLSQRFWKNYEMWSYSEHVLYNFFNPTAATQNLEVVRKNKYIIWGIEESCVLHMQFWSRERKEITSKGMEDLKFPSWIEFHSKLKSSNI